MVEEKPVIPRRFEAFGQIYGYTTMAIWIPKRWWGYAVWEYFEISVANQRVTKYGWLYYGLPNQSDHLHQGTLEAKRLPGFIHHQHRLLCKMQSCLNSRRPWQKNCKYIHHARFVSCLLWMKLALIPTPHPIHRMLRSITALIFIINAPNKAILIPKDCKSAWKPPRPSTQRGWSNYTSSTVFEPPNIEFIFQGSCTMMISSRRSHNTGVWWRQVSRA